MVTSKTTLDAKVMKCGEAQVNELSIKVFHHDSSLDLQVLRLKHDSQPLK